MTDPIRVLETDELEVLDGAEGVTLIAAGTDALRFRLEDGTEYVVYACPGGLLNPHIHTAEVLDTSIFEDEDF